MTEPDVPRWASLAWAGYTALTLVFCAGALAGFAFQSRLFALIAVAALTLQFCINVAVSVVTYRRIMRRPWPAIPPLADDDEW